MAPSDASCCAGSVTNVNRSLHSHVSMTVTGPVTIRDNDASYRGGGIYNEGSVVLPTDAEISGNVAISVSPARVSARVLPWTQSPRLSAAPLRGGSMRQRDAYIAMNCTTFKGSGPPAFSPKHIAASALIYLLAPYSASSAKCPGIANMGSEALVEFTGDTSYTGSSEYLCYLGAPTIEDSAPTQGILEADCDVLLSNAPMLGFYYFMVLDSREFSSMDIDATGDVEFRCHETLVSTASLSIPRTEAQSRLASFRYALAPLVSILSHLSLTSCYTRDRFRLSQLLFVTGGGELSLTSSADSLTFSKVRFEILGHTKLVLDLPSTTVTGFQRSVSTNAGKHLLIKCASHQPSLLAARSTSLSPQEKNPDAFHLFQFRKISQPSR